MPSELEITPDCGVLARTHVQLEIVDGQVVLLNLETAEFFGLDEIAKRVWDILSEGASIKQAATTMSLDYEASEDQILVDIIGLISNLRDLGLVRVDHTGINQ